MLQLKETDHNYYCSETNYYVGNANGENWGRAEFDTWEEFKNEWLEPDLKIDLDYNLCFRYDIKRRYDPETDEELPGYSLLLFFILQRKGIFKPVAVKSIKDDDIKEIETFLKFAWAYHKDQWIEIDTD